MIEIRNRIGLRKCIMRLFVNQSVNAPLPALYRNMEGDNNLPIEDYVGRALPLETPILMIESGVDGGGQWYIVKNMPSAPTIFSDPYKWGMWSMTVLPQPDTSARKITQIATIGEYNGHTNCCKIWVYGAIAGIQVNDRMAFCLPNGYNVTLKSNPEFQRQTGAWNNSFTGMSCVWKHSDGTYHGLVVGFNLTNPVGSQIKHHLFTAPTFMGTWTDITGAANGDTLAPFYIPGYVSISSVHAPFPHPTQPDYFIAAAGLILANGRTDSAIMIFDEDLSDVTIFPITIGYIPDVYCSGHYSATYFNNKYYYVIHDGTYNSGKRILLSCNTVDGTYEYHSTIIDFADFPKDNMFTASIGGGTLEILNNRLYYISSGTGNHFYSGNYNNFEAFLWSLNDSQWLLKTAPLMVANHGAFEFGFAWGYDHMSVLSNFIIENHKAYFTLAMNNGTDTYQGTVGYIDLNENNDWKDAPIMPSPPSPPLTTLKDGLVSVYEFEDTTGNILDDLHRYNDAATSGITKGVIGKNGNAYQLIPANLPRINFASRLVAGFPFTLSFWLKKGVGNNINFYTNNRSTAYSGLIIDFKNTGGLDFHYGDGNGLGGGNRYSLTSASIPALIDGNWHHVVITATGKEAANTKLYFDNVAKEITYTSGSAGVISFADGKGSIGYHSVSTTIHNEGHFDQLTVHGRILSLAEIALLYNSGNGLPYINF